jgi:uncharacterized delta-60 repeat protein
MVRFSKFFFCLVVLTACKSGGLSGLDTQFGTSGITTIDFNSEDRAYGVATNSSSVFVVGYTRVSTNDFAIAKLTSSGSLDTAFNSTGKATADFSGGEDTAYAAAIQSDGKVIVVGKTTSGGNTSLAAARWNTDGTLDSSGFGTGGQFTQLFGSGSAEYRAVSLDSAGRILVAGTATIAGKSSFLLTRLTTAGALDTTFGSSGSVSITPGSIGDTARALVVTSSRIYVAGTQLVGTSSTTGNFAVVSYSLDGTLDTGFGTAGIASFDFETAFPGGTRDDNAYAVAIDDNSRIAVMGTSRGTSGTRLAAVFFTSTGSVDTTMGTNGAVLLQVEQTLNGTQSTINSTLTSGLFSNSGFLLAGNASTTPLSSIVLTKVSSNGVANTSFGTNGFAFLSKNSAYTETNASAVYSNRWTLAGSYYNSGWDFIVFRYRI